MCRPSRSSASIHLPGQTASSEFRKAEPPGSPDTNSQRLRLSPVTSGQALGKGSPASLKLARWPQHLATSLQEGP